MRPKTTNRGFDVVEHPVYPPNGEQSRLLQCSSAIGDYDDSFDKPGSSYLWIGDKHHLDRSEVIGLIEMLALWVKTGRLAPTFTPNTRIDFGRPSEGNDG